jgi:hypothetical protein
MKIHSSVVNEMKYTIQKNEKKYYIFNGAIQSVSIVEKKYLDDEEIPRRPVHRQKGYDSTHIVKR